MQGRRRFVTKAIHLVNRFNGTLTGEKERSSHGVYLLEKNTPIMVKS